MNVVMVPLDALRPAPWRVNYILKPDLRLLKGMIEDAGILQPLLVRKEDSTIIDGFHRWDIARQVKIAEVPVVYLDVDEIDAMLWHVRLNRGRGMTYAKALSRLMREVTGSGKYGPAALEEILVMTPDEVDLLADGSILKRRNVIHHKYSASWVPVEVPKGATVVTPQIERPPNGDR